MQYLNFDHSYGVYMFLPESYGIFLYVCANF